MRSIVGVVGEGFPRLRVGVAPADPTAEIGELVEHVLAPFTADEREAAEAAIARATEAVEGALRDGITRAMVKLNGSGQGGHCPPSTPRPALPAPLRCLL